MRRILSTTALVSALAIGSSAAAETTLQLVEVITSPARTEHLEGMLAKFEEANPEGEDDVADSVALFFLLISLINLETLWGQHPQLSSKLFSSFI